MKTLVVPFGVSFLAFPISLKFLIWVSPPKIRRLFITLAPILEDLLSISLVLEFIKIKSMMWEILIVTTT